MNRTSGQVYDAWLAGLSPETIRQMFLDRGCTQVLVKRLSSRQDNDKNQIYVGADLSEVASIPSGDVVASFTRSNKPGAAGETKFTAPVDWVWIAPRGDSAAPQAKLIFYPQYPEVRLSGLLQHSVDPPRSLYARTARGQEAGRRLLIGLSPTQPTVWAMILPPEAIALDTIEEEMLLNVSGVFARWDLTVAQHTDSTLEALLDRLAEIHEMGLVPGQILQANGPVPYSGMNAHGYTLEALCGVMPNGDAQPDYLGWELKAHRAGNSLTLFTPAPDGGFIANVPRIDFMRRYGRHRPASGNEPERWDFTGRHYFGRPNASTDLVLDIYGWDGAHGVQPDGGVILLAPDGETTMLWSFERIMNLWKIKHSQTVYVPCMAEMVAGEKAFQFGDEVLLCTGTSFLHLLRGFAVQAVFYDPGLNIKWEEGVRGFRWKPHDRHQFRASLRNVGPLYDNAEWILSTVR